MIFKDLDDLFYRRMVFSQATAKGREEWMEIQDLRLKKIDGSN